jgi:hypothetical protein
VAAVRRVRARGRDHVGGATERRRPAVRTVADGAAQDAREPFATACHGLIVADGTLRIPDPGEQTWPMLLVPRPSDGPSAKGTERPPGWEIRGAACWGNLVSIRRGLVARTARLLK